MNSTKTPWWAFLLPLPVVWWLALLTAGVWNPGMNLLELLEKKRKKVNRKEKEGVLDKSFEVQDYEKIKEWLER